MVRCRAMIGRRVRRSAHRNLPLRSRRHPDRLDRSHHGVVPPHDAHASRRGSRRDALAGRLRYTAPVATARVRAGRRRGGAHGRHLPRLHGRAPRPAARRLHRDRPGSRRPAQRRHPPRRGHQQDPRARPARTGPLRPEPLLRRPRRVRRRRRAQAAAGAGARGPRAPGNGAGRRALRRRLAPRHPRRTGRGGPDRRRSLGTLLARGPGARIAPSLADGTPEHRRPRPVAGRRRAFFVTMCRWSQPRP